MIGLQLLPVVLSLIVLGAHFLRAGNVVMVLAVLALLGLLGVRRSWAARVIQAALLLGAVEWVRTLAALASWRKQAGEPAVRLILILGGVALWTGLSALVFRSARLRARYGLGQARDSGGADLAASAKRYAEAWCSQAPEKVASFFATDGSLCVNGAAPAVGRAAIAEVASGFMTAFPDLVVTMDALVRKSDGVEFHWTLAGTNAGPGGTGMRVRISGHEDWRINPEGLIVESKGHFDAAEYERQLRHGIQT